MKVWKGRAAPLRDAAIPLEDPKIKAHLARARGFLDRHEATQGEEGPRSPLADIPRSAAFLSNGGPTVHAANRAAEVAFGIRNGESFVALPFDVEDRRLLSGGIRRIAEHKAERAMTIRIRSSATGSPVILRVSPVEGGGTRPLTLVVPTELIWPERFALSVQEAFGLTPAEVEIVRGVTLGLPVRDIAEARGRSVETVRTQVRSVLAKTETHSQADLERVVLGLMDLALIPAWGEAPPGHVGGLVSRRVQEMRGPDGRRLTWIEFGDPCGAPVLYTHIDLGLTRWPASAERACALRRMRVIVPVRVGYGRTEALAKGPDHLEGVTRDYAAVLEHLDLKGAVVVPMGADLRFAMNLANTRPDLVPVLLLQGDQNPQAPVLTMQELAADCPHLAMRFLPGNGQLLFFSEWPTVLDEVSAPFSGHGRLTPRQRNSRPYRSWGMKPAAGSFCRGSSGADWRYPISANPFLNPRQQGLDPCRPLSLARLDPNQGAAGRNVPSSLMDEDVAAAAAPGGDGDGRQSDRSGSGSGNPCGHQRAETVPGSQ